MVFINFYWRSERFFKSIVYFLKNAWFFRKELSNFRSWDWAYTMGMISKSLDLMNKEINEDNLSFPKDKTIKYESLKRAAEIASRISDEDYYRKRAEEELGPVKDHKIEFVKLEDGNFNMIDDMSNEDRSHWRNVIKRSIEIENQEWEDFIACMKDLKNWWT